MVIRDCNGIVLMATAAGYSASFFPLVSETAALKRGLELALEVGFSNLVVETDSLTLIKAINSNLLPFSKIGNFVKDISILIHNLGILNISFIYRKVNKTVDALAKFGLF
ncbi:hypothetical protein ACOSQ3_000546 [Xanthoceras sorbifolium]